MFHVAHWLGHQRMSGLQGRAHDSAGDQNNEQQVHTVMTVHFPYMLIGRARDERTLVHEYYHFVLSHYKAITINIIHNPTRDVESLDR